LKEGRRLVITKAVKAGGDIMVVAEPAPKV